MLINFSKARIFLALFFIFGCVNNSNNEKVKVIDPQVELIKKGKMVYMTTCVLCHNQNPRLQGPVGPDLYGTSLEVIRSKITKGTYPEGYTSKRKTQLMPLFEDEHGKDVEAIHAFLNQP